MERGWDIQNPMVDRERLAADQIQLNLAKNLYLAFRQTSRIGAQTAWAEQIQRNAGHVSTALRRAETIPPSRRMIFSSMDLKSAAIKTHLDTGPGTWDPDWWHLPHEEFARKLRERGFGKYGGRTQPLAFLDTLTRPSSCDFVPVRTLRMLLANYRSWGAPVSVAPDEPVDAVCTLDDRYGLLTALPDGPVLAAAMVGNAVAVTVQDNRCGTPMQVWGIDPTTPGATSVVWAMPEAPADQDEAADAVTDPMSPCIIAGSRDGDPVRGKPGLRDVYLFVFDGNSVSDELRKFLYEQDLDLTDEIRKVLQTNASIAARTRHVEGLHFVYQAVEATSPWRR